MSCYARAYIRMTYVRKGIRKITMRTSCNLKREKVNVQARVAHNKGKNNKFA